MFLYKAACKLAVSYFSDSTLLKYSATHKLILNAFMDHILDECPHLFCSIKLNKFNACACNAVLDVPVKFRSVSQTQHVGHIFPKHDPDFPFPHRDNCSVPVILIVACIAFSCIWHCMLCKVLLLTFSFVGSVG